MSLGAQWLGCHLEAHAICQARRLPLIFSMLALVGGARHRLIAEPEHREQDLNIAGRAQLQRLIGLAAASNPGRKHRHVGRIEGHQVARDIRGRLAEHISRPIDVAGFADARRSASGKGTPSRRMQFLTAVAMRNGPGERPVVGEATAIPDSDVFPMENETGPATADGRHRIGYQQRAAEAT